MNPVLISDFLMFLFNKWIVKENYAPYAKAPNEILPQVDYFSVFILMYCDYRAYSYFAYKSFGGTTMQASCLYKRILICEALLAFCF